MAFALSHTIPSTSFTQRKFNIQKSAATLRNKVCSRSTSLRVLSAVEIPSKFSTVSPNGNRVFVKADKAEESTAGGVLLPSSTQEKSTSGVILGVGSGCKELKEGDSVFFSKFGINITKFQFEKEEHVLLSEEEVIGAIPVGGDIPDLKPCGDRVLVKPFKPADASTGGVLLPESAKDKPMTGEVIAAGPGTPDKEVKVTTGDKIVYFKWAGDKMKAKNGAMYVVLRQQDIFGKLN
mmetsp:Transcript_30202/g.41808  ORF Transcript_30202/g.41808 Transcript_30202/m.41808 type:complete len:236 (-) Transcript_30202:158-865(-)|eukprot:CAMPEP_0196581816 /NCGR_PEP_ID=MMETSP1081-20130531/35800_1 /TAXON_ID=36882 /ORGANISM="Pyramimonas amylifera, Strain CCMP720" /LENGTH=235 /DNA_ID=CAMNT_0041902183 /DNA_START=96 /DNA_END=803 /DNA_ORIENTATION=-